MSHFREECIHGKEGSQCRCMSADKQVHIISCAQAGCDLAVSLTDDQITEAAYEQIFENAESLLQDWIDEEGEYSREDYFKIRSRAFELVRELRQRYQ